MKLTVKVMEITDHVVGHGVNGAWETDSVVFADPNGMFSLAMRVFGGEERKKSMGLVVGNIGELEFDMQALLTKNNYYLTTCKFKSWKVARNNIERKQDIDEIIGEGKDNLGQIVAANAAASAAPSPTPMPYTSEQVDLPF